MSIEENLKNAEVTTWLYDMFTEEEHAESRCRVEISMTIEDQRKAKGYTQKDLAKKLGVSQAMVSRWENGEENLTIATLAKIAVALGLELGNPFEIPKTLSMVAEDESNYDSSKAN